MIKYIGSKRAVAPLLERLAARLPITTACDLFSGTTRAGQAFRRAGVRVVSNDLASYSEAFGQAYIARDAAAPERALARWVARLQDLPGRAGYVTETFCRQARFFSEENGARIDAIRAAIAAAGLDPVTEGCLLTSLIEAADRVDSTCGVQMAYLKRPAARSLQPLRLRVPDPVPGPAGSVVRAPANDLAPALDVDCVYLDPPYNQHSYFANYHAWETIARGDRPEAYGVARKRIDCRGARSPYNGTRSAWPALEDLVASLRTPWIVMSVSDESFLAPADVAHLLSARGHTAALAMDVPRYVGARIGIHNPAGERVGRVSHLRTTEWLIVSGPDRAAVRAAFDGESLSSAA